MTDRPAGNATLVVSSTAEFERPQTNLEVVGVLTPVAPCRVPAPIPVTDVPVVIGRGGRDDGVTDTVADPDVSRRHVRLSRRGDRFLLEDLNSRNGSFVDGVPVRTCELHDGDTVQVGRNLFYFDRLLDFPEERDPAGPPPAGGASGGPPKPVPRPKDGMTLRFWGTRGSIPTPGGGTAKFGGNTTCLEVRRGDTLIVIDAGSGLRELGKGWFGEFAGRPIHADLLFTHLHWDHIQGFPFFGVAYAPGNTVTIRGADHEAGSTEELLDGQMRGAYFPVPLAAMGADLQFHKTESQFRLGSIDVRTTPLPHPGGSLGFRLSAGNSTFVLATDSEFDQVALNPDAIARDHHAAREYPPHLLGLLADADLLVIDCQYTDAQYAAKRGWGHNSVAAVVDLCRQVKPGMVALTHHDPESDDEAVAALVADAADRLRAAGCRDTLLFGAREGLCLDVRKPLRPSRR